MPEIERIGDQADEHQGPERERPGDDGCPAGAGIDDQRGPKAGHQGCHAGELGLLGVGEEAPAHQTQPGQPGGVAHKALGRTGEGAEREQRTHQQLPAARRREIEGGRRVAHGPPNADAQRHEKPGTEERKEPAPSVPVEQHQRDRIDDIELLLDGQRPGVEQRPDLRAAVEVAELVGEVDVRGEEGGCRPRFPHIHELVRQQDPATQREGYEEDDDEGGEMRRIRRS